MSLGFWPARRSELCRGGVPAGAEPGADGAEEAEAAEEGADADAEEEEEAEAYDGSGWCRRPALVVGIEESGGKLAFDADADTELEAEAEEEEAPSTGTLERRAPLRLPPALAPLPLPLL